MILVAGCVPGEHSEALIALEEVGRFELPEPKRAYFVGEVVGGEVTVLDDEAECWRVRVSGAAFPCGRVPDDVVAAVSFEGNLLVLVRGSGSVEARSVGGREIRLGVADIPSGDRVQSAVLCTSIVGLASGATDAEPTAIYVASMDLVDSAQVQLGPVLRVGAVTGRGHVMTCDGGRVLVAQSDSPFTVWQARSGSVEVFRARGVDPDTILPPSHLEYVPRWLAGGVLRTEAYSVQTFSDVRSDARVLAVFRDGDSRALRARVIDAPLGLASADSSGSVFAAVLSVDRDVIVFYRVGRGGGTLDE